MGLGSWSVVVVNSIKYSESDCFFPCADSGFSLIEVLVSMGILAVGLLAVMSMQTATLRANLNNQNLLMAEQVAETAVESVRSMKFSKSDTDGELIAKIFPTLGKDSVSGLDSQYQFTGLVSAGSGFPSGIASSPLARFSGYRIRYVQDPDRPHIDRDFVVRIAVERNYRSLLSRCAATVYWMQDGEIVSFNVIFFVERRA